MGSERGSYRKSDGESLRETTSRMLKKAPSFVLASLRGSTYRKAVRFASSLSAAALDGLFEHPAGYFESVSDFQQPCVSTEQGQFFNNLLDYSPV